MDPEMAASPVLTLVSGSLQGLASVRFCCGECPDPLNTREGSSLKTCGKDFEKGSLFFQFLRVSLRV